MIRSTVVLALGTLAFGAACAVAQSADVAIETTTPVVYTFQGEDFKGDPFTQLLGINKNEMIAGYHGSGLNAANPNKGFVFTTSNGFVNENYPKSAQTQVIGINNAGDTAGFYVDSKGQNHGFVTIGTSFTNVDYPGTNFNQLLGFNNLNEAAGYYQDSKGNQHPYIWQNTARVFELITIFGSSSGQATGINDSGAICGFYVDSKGVTRGFLLNLGNFHQVMYPGSTSTSVLGINNSLEMVGTYTDAQGNTHGFTDKGGVYQTVDDPHGVGSTIVNGLNDAGVLVGFYGNTGAGISNGFIATPAK
jgi:hypothetical protein